MNNLYSIRDIKADYYMQPFSSRNHGEARRSFTGAVSDKSNPNNLMAQYPADYELFFLGTFDEVTGELERAQIESLGTGDTYVQQR